MYVEEQSYKGTKCLILRNNMVELCISLCFGPRILSYGFIGGQNFFHVFDEQITSNEKDIWHIYGGHRLWLAPEDLVRSYFPDNHPIKYTHEGNTVSLIAPVETFAQVQKIIDITLEENNTHVYLNHRIINRNAWSIEFSAWALSVMRAGGRAIIPHEQYKPHPEACAPARPLVLWHFTAMDDPRFRWGKRYIQMSQDNAYENKLKIGVLNTKGQEAYILGDEVFIKKHDYIAGASYPDMGCNTEFFTMPHFLEVESLSPLRRVEPNDEICHKETWQLKKISVGTNEDDIDAIFT